MGTPDLYAALDVPRDADGAAVHAAYRQAAKAAHPDAGGAPERWALVSLAHDVLTDPDRRARYDATGEAEAEAPDNRTAAALGMLNGCLDELMMASPHIDELVLTDVVASLRRKLEEHAGKRHRQIAEIDSAIAINKRLLGRFERRDGAPNLLEQMVAGRVAEFERRRAQAKQALVMLADARALLDGYVFRADAPPRAPYGSQTWPALGMMQQGWWTWG